MATTPKNRITRSVVPQSVFPDATALTDTTISYNQGDLLFLDTTAHLIKAVATESTDSATFLGIATETVVLGKLKYPYSTDVDASSAASVLPGPQFGVVAKLILKTGDSLNPGDLVYAYPTVDAQHVAATGTYAIGAYQGAAISGAAAGTQVEVYLGCEFPAHILRW